MYDRLACSAEVPIETLTDIKKVALCSVDTTQTISEYWRWSPRDLMRYGKLLCRRLWPTSTGSSPHAGI